MYETMNLEVFEQRREEMLREAGLSRLMKDPVNPRNPIPARSAQSEERDEHFAVPLGSSRSGSLRFTGGAHRLLVRADSRVRSHFRARFGDRKPRVGVHGGIVTIRYPRSSNGDWTNCRSELTAEIVLNTSIPWDVEVRGGASRLLADLRELRLGSSTTRRAAGGRGLTPTNFS